MVSQSLVGIVLIEHGKFGYSNAKFAEIFGYTPDEVRDLEPLDIVIESDRPLVARTLGKQRSGELERVEYVFRGLRKDGAVVDIACHSNATDVGSTSLLTSLMIDITERVRAEQELRTLQDRLREESRHDPLTGLYNRRYLKDTLARELIRAERAAHPVSVILADIDHFKAVNDRLGHLAGDEVLRVFGGLMKRSARASDIYCRYGGEEFLLVLPGMAQRSAADRAEQLRSAIAAAPVEHGATQIAVTASFGVAAFPCHGRTGDELIAAADSALYAAKAAGRNRVEVSAEPVSALASQP